MSQVSEAWSLANQIAIGIERWLKEHEGKLFYVHFKKADLLRLLKLQVWCDRYYVDLDELLSLILPYLRKSLLTNKRAGNGLGVSIASLTGEGAEKILVEAIRLKYPSKEHIALWREREQQRQLMLEEREDLDGLEPRRSAGKGILESESITDFIESYRQRVLSAREKDRKAHASARRRRKHYRFNPWL